MLNNIYPFTKRFFDVLGALLLAIPLLPIIVLIGLLTVLEDGFPIFYNSLRMGKSGTPFKMFKFRSMYNNSPDLRNSDGSTVNSPTDPRVTHIGRFIRRTSIDELPQIFNVIIGDMSFVGPRPSLTNTPYDQYNEVRKKRISVRPGITGYSQAYFRNSIGQEEKFRHDCYYVDNMSFLLDLKILCKTFASVFRSKNIYNKQV